MSNASPVAGIQLRRFESSGGAQIFQIPLEEFPGFWGYVYLVLAGEYRLLIDAGSGHGPSNQMLDEGVQAAAAMAGLRLHLADLTHVLITHGHIDHFGGLGYVRPRTAAQIGVHELDLRNLTHYEERLTVVARRLAEYLIEAGVAPERREQLIQLYQITKSLHRSVQVDFTYEAAGMRLGPFSMLHTPGHCAGHVVIRLDDVLFSGDHILESTSPHQSPEHLTLYNGLGHYLQSLDTLQGWTGGIRLTLGGHKEPIHDLPGRIADIRSLHRQRLGRVLELLEMPRTISEVSHLLFGEVHGYNVLLALEETGAHIEYLYQRGLLGIDNLTELVSGAGPQPIRYRRLEPLSAARPAGNGLGQPPFLTIAQPE